MGEMIDVKWSYCVFHPYIHQVAEGAGGTGPTSFTASQVHESLKGLDAFSGAYLSPRTTTFACVDSRAPAPDAVPSLETPGGDLAELQAAIVIYHRLMKTAPTTDSVNRIFKAFVRSKYITTNRPFYFHTAESK